MLDSKSYRKLENKELSLSHHKKEIKLILVNISTVKIKFRIGFFIIFNDYKTK